MESNGWLLLAASGTFLAAALHVACIFLGPAWYDAMGAGERIVRWSREGRRKPALITSAIILMLVIWALYALAGAGLFSTLPAARFVLAAITTVLLLRGMAGLALARFRPGYNGARFWIVSSAACLVLGGMYLIGTAHAWSRL
ncbi:hypothetical protein E8E95_08925 [Pseudomonas sp. BN414]|uniref:hypothetical protein n=1 Tax=Pseudomonas sp. BN414 TaxID=2567888 RepID=UPI002456BF8F|nr:hypothetical protein [Pseudomonas sp. BN414]MDH4566799.1 hypothetical protein [Pseudomonas sp. BN414]